MSGRASPITRIVETKHPGMDVVIVRENEEDVYGGIEHRLTNDVTQCLKLITRGGCERIVRTRSSTRAGTTARRSRASPKTTS